MATKFSIFAWGIPWTEESGGLHFMGLQRVGHDLVTKQQQRKVHSGLEKRNNTKIWTCTTTYRGDTPTNLGQLQQDHQTFLTLFEGGGPFDPSSLIFTDKTRV